MNTRRKFRVGILGATGMVGQRIVALLEHHPWFEVAAVCASERSAGKLYGDTVTWHVETPIPEKVAAMRIQACDPTIECDFVLSSMVSSAAGPIEEAFAAAGYPVISNARNHRMEPDVPLVIPEVNPHHLEMIATQRANRGWGRGLIVTNPNCSTIGMVCALAPLVDKFGVGQVFITTMQALSGAGHPGVSSADIADNVLPYIDGEEEKIETESRKIWGFVHDNIFKDLNLQLSAQCNRVAVSDGHLACISVELARSASQQDVLDAWRDYIPRVSRLSLPSIPTPFIHYLEEDNRPQPRLDRNLGRGMAISIGRLRPCRLLDYKFITLSHNTIRGAAGAAIANAELLSVNGYFA